MQQRPQRVAPQAAQTPLQAAQGEGGTQQPQGDGNALAASPAPRTRPRFGIPTTKLAIPPNLIKEGFRPRWINDAPGRIDYAKQCGYEHIKENGKNLERVVDRGTGMKAYAMQIPEEFYQADFADKQRDNDQIDHSIMRTPIADHGYRPTIGGTDQPVSQSQVITGRLPTV